jgi:hypothetical protein
MRRAGVLAAASHRASNTTSSSSARYVSLISGLFVRWL